MLIPGGKFGIVRGDAKESKIELGVIKLYDHISADAFHNSKERSKEANPEIVRVIVDEWLSRLRLITGTSTLSQASSSSSLPSVIHTTENVLKDIFNWLYNQSCRHLVMWVHDERRNQTSLIAQVVAEVLNRRHELSAAFFSSSRESQIGNAQKNRASCVIPTLAYQLWQKIPQVQSFIAQKVSCNWSIFELETEAQLKKLVVEPLVRASNLSSPDAPRRSTGVTRFIVIHALEDLEEEDDDFQSTFLYALCQALRRLKCEDYSQKLLILGRYTDRLKECFSGTTMHSLVLQRPIVLDNLFTQAELLKERETILSSREKELGQVAKALFEQRQAMEQREERLRMRERYLEDTQMQQALIQEETTTRKEELKILEEELQRRDRVRREKEEELREAAKVLSEEHQQWEEELSVKELYLEGAGKVVKDAAIRGEEEMRRKVEEMTWLEDGLRERREVQMEKEKVLARARKTLHEQQRKMLTCAEELNGEPQQDSRIIADCGRPRKPIFVQMPVTGQEVTGGADQPESLVIKLMEAFDREETEQMLEEVKQRVEEAERRVEETEKELEESRQMVEEAELEVSVAMWRVIEGASLMVQEAKNINTLFFENF